MILVDTSTLIDFIKGKKNAKTDLFKEILQNNTQFGIASFTYMEALQGAREEAEYLKLKRMLNTRQIYYLENDIITYEKAARLYYDLRRQGITIRNSIDILIALIAIENDLQLLHNDKDFDIIAEKISALKIYNSHIT